MDKVRVSRAVAGLLRANLIVRRIDPGDRRRARLSLSAKGEGIYRRIAPLALAREAELVAALSECERGQLDRLLAKLQARADSVSDGLAAEAPD